LNFKTALSFPILILSIVSCGVKSDPSPPSDTILPSIEKQFMLSPLKDTEKDEKDNKKK